MRVVVSLCLALCGTLACNRSDDETGGPEIVSALSLPTTRGEMFDPSTLSGKRTLVNIWSVSCGVCLHEMPELQAAVDNHPGAALVLVTLDGRPARAESTARARRITAPILMANHDFARRVDVRATPTTFVVDASGRTERVLVGERSRAGFERALRGDD